MNIYKISSKALAKRPLLCKLLLKKASRLFSCMALATFWQPANILEFFVFQSSFPNHFRKVGQKIKITILIYKPNTGQIKSS